jgi:hypothetical protein
MVLKLINIYIKEREEMYGYLAVFGLREPWFKY